ncbi:MAG TPA: hypothetical protein VGH54_21595 [Mycobacterium sp.]|jgi:hypothetical protein|uniref:hypothetical protein n=1 Tax=Mycobacterium sp. TaxID=1785 RepID=UPI002F3E9EF7
MRFKIGTKTYNGADLDRLSLKDILMLENETAELGKPLKWTQVQEWEQDLDRLTRIVVDETKSKAVRDAAMKEREDHPGNIWVMALVIWSSRRLAGELISFGDAIDFPMKDLQFLPEPTDHKSSANPTKARPRKGSGRAAKPRAGAATRK